MSEASKASVFIDANNYYIDYGNSDIYTSYPDIDEIIYRRSYDYPDLNISARTDSKINLFLSLQQDSAYTIQVKTQGDIATISYTFDAISDESESKVWTNLPYNYEEYNPETGQYETKTDSWPTTDIVHSKEYASITQTLTITDFSPEKFQSITFGRHTFHSWQAFADFVAANPDFYKNATEGNDTIIGIHEANQINAQGGDDTVTTKEGNDTVNGGAGNDIIHTGDGDDKLDGGTGADKLYGGRGDDTYYVDNTADQVIEYADQGTDTVYSSVSHTLATNVENLVLTGNANIFGAGNNSDNILTGNEGNNRLNSGRGNDTVYGKGGNDTLNGGEGNDHLDGGDGDDTVNGEAGNDTLIGGKGKDSLNGGTGNDNYIYTKGDGSDLITDASGIDTLTFKGGINLDDLSIYAVKTRQGTDWEINIAGTNDVITIKNQVNANGTYAIEQFVLGNTTFEAKKLELYASDEIITVTLNGTSRNDTLIGTIGNDTIDGKAGADKMSGGRGDDTYIVDNISDTVTELANQGRDTVISSVSHTLATNVEDLVLTGHAHIFGAGNNSDNILKGNDGNNRLNSGRGNDTVYGGKGDDTINTGDGNDYAWGGDGNDTINGDEGHDHAWGGSGNDTLRGENGNDYLSGDKGNDSLYGGNGNDIIEAGDGNDYVQGDQGNDVIDGGDGDDYLLGEDGNDIINGGDGDDYLLGEDGNDIINGGKGNDTIFGGYTPHHATEDNDIIHGNEGDDVIYGELGADIIYGDDGNDTIIGGEGYVDPWDGDIAAEAATPGNKLYGGNGNDKIYGKYAADLLDGGSGDDHLYGGEGNDTYFFGIGYGTDIIVDTAGNDTVKFGDGILLDHLHTEAVVNSKGGLDWMISVSGSNDSLTIADQPSAIDTFILDDGSSYTAAQFLALTQKAQAGLALSLDWGSDIVSHTSSALSAATVATVNSAKLAALSASSHTNGSNSLLDNSSADAHVLDSSLSMLTDNTIGDTGSLANVNAHVENLSYTTNNITFDDTQNNNPAV